MTPFTLFLRGRLDRIRPLLRERAPMRIALHRHPGVHGVVEAAEEILCAVPSNEVVDLQQPAGRTAGQQFARPAAVPPHAAGAGASGRRSSWRRRAGRSVVPERKMRPG
jgi:hypothetical protein